jgi:tetrahydromethanopterin S-methyltransferase subunit D
VLALVASICGVGFWLIAALLNVFTVYVTEYAFDDDPPWYTIRYVEATMQVVFSIIFSVMMGFAAVAVHKWRMAKKNKWVANGK